MEMFVCIKMNLALNSLRWLMCHKTKPNQTKPKLNWYENKLLPIHVQNQEILHYIMVGWLDLMTYQPL